MDEGQCPRVSVVVATRGRDVLLRRALASILAQQYAGEVEVIVVYDQVEVARLDDVRSGLPQGRTLLTLANERRPGLAGGRNTGIAHASGELVAFCDDDDEWAPTRLSAQIALWGSHPDAVGMATAIEIVTTTSRVTRTPELVSSREDFLASRIGEIHPSSFLFRREDLRGLDGGVDEGIPHSYGEDYDLLLRLTERGPIVSVQDPLVIVHWDRDSYFAGRWIPMAEGLAFVVGKHPDLLDDPRNAGRMCGQIAFAYAAGGENSPSWDWIRRTWRHRLVEPRAWLALAVVMRLVSPQRLVEILNKRGKGI